MYAIKHTFWNNKGQHQKKILKMRYKTWRNAEKTADKTYRYICRDYETGEVLERSSAEVIEVKR